MAAETFDQRFKRLTSDLLMVDICRTLGIEIRDLMKVRAGIRVDLNMDRLKKLCQEQALDFPSFVRDYNQPWSNEIKTTNVITSEGPAPVRRRAVEAAAPAAAAAKVGSAPSAPPPGKNTPDPTRFREDGSRIVEQGKQARLSDLPILHGDDGPVFSEPPAPKVVDRIKAAVAGAAAFLGAEPLPTRGDDLVIENGHHVPVEAVDRYNYPEPKKLGSESWNTGDHETLQTILGEVTELRREVDQLSNRIQILIGR